jgi:hypothetical protein
MIFVLSECIQPQLSIFDLGFENPLGGGALDKFRSSLYTRDGCLQTHSCRREVCECLVAESFPPCARARGS